MRNNRDSGFSLIELMIVVAIIAILAAVAYPTYRDQIIASRRAEGKAKLVEMAQALEKCRAMYGRYNPKGAGGTDICNAYDSVTDGNMVPSENGFYQISDATPGGGNRATEFTLQAVPQQTDPTCGTLKLRQNSERCVKLGSGSDICGNSVPDGCW